MDSSTIAAIIAGLATVTAATIGLVKKKSNVANSANGSTVGNTSESNVAIGSNITQSYQGVTHNYYGATLPDSLALHGRVASKPSLVEIAQAIQSAKPYDQILMSRNYVGLSVSWPVIFSSIREGDESNSWYVSFDSPEKHFIWVSAYLDIEKFPKLKVIDSGHPSWIEGRIVSVSTSHVQLEANPKIILE